jgi:hypothetical protein
MAGCWLPAATRGRENKQLRNKPCVVSRGLGGGQPPSNIIVRRRRRPIWEGPKTKTAINCVFARTATADRGQIASCCYNPDDSSAFALSQMTKTPIVRAFYMNSSLLFGSAFPSALTSLCFSQSARERSMRDVTRARVRRMRSFSGCAGSSRRDSPLFLGERKNVVPASLVACESARSARKTTTEFSLSLSLSLSTYFATARASVQQKKHTHTDIL